MCSVSVLAPRPRGVGSLYKVRVFGNNLQEVFTTFFIGAKGRHRGEFYVRKKSTLGGLGCIVQESIQRSKYQVFVSIVALNINCDSRGLPPMKDWHSRTLAPE